MAADSQIVSTFKDQTIFMTGATGFLGKVVVEKLIRECEGLKKIYILIRPKKGKSLEERYQEIFEQPCFAPLMSKNANVKEKVILIGGDCQQPLLGLSNDDLESLKKETNIVLHLAANVKFDQSLKEAALNVQATRDLLDIGKEMTNLKAFVFVSTAYSNCIHPRIKEQIYEPPMTCELLVNLVKECEDDILENLTPHLLGKWPNTYIYTKSISESLVANASDYFPTAIVRPGIVLNAAKEPLVGWVDNIYGPIGVSVGAGYGIIRSYHAVRKLISHIVAVDYVCNCVLAATWMTAKEKSPKIKIYNYIRHSQKFLRLGEYSDWTLSKYWEYAPDNIVWYKSFALRDNRRWNEVCQFVLHTIPAYLIDGVLWCLGKPTIAVKAYQKLHKALALSSFFSTRTWTFEDDNVTSLWNDMGDEDKRLFTFRNESLEWKEYLYGCVRGMKLFLVKEKVDNSFRKHAKLTIFMIMHYAVVLVFWYLVFKFLMFILGMLF